LASTTLTPKVKVPVCVGVPASVPDDERLIPLGNDPTPMLNVYGAAPPLAVSAAEYAVPSVADDSEVGETLMVGQLVAMTRRWVAESIVQRAV
jgi:hypothetical protein